MNTIQRITKNVGVLFLSQIVVFVIGLFNVMYTARYLGVEKFGLLSFALSLAGIYGIISNPGFTSLTIREVAKNKSLAGKYLTNIIIMQLLLALVNIGLIYITMNILDYQEQTIRVIYLITLSTIFNTFSGMFYSIFQAYERMEYQSIGQIMSSTLMLSGILFVMSQKWSLFGFALIYCIASAIVLLYTFVVCIFKFDIPKVEVDFNFWISAIKEALPFGMATIFAMLYIYIDSILLSIMKGAIEVGWYNSAYRLVLFLSIIPTVYLTSIFPVISRLYNTSEDLLKFAFERSLKYMVMLAIPIAIGTTILANKIIVLLFGPEYAPSTAAMQILIWSEVFIYISLPCAYLLRSINRQNEDMKATGLGVVINIILNLLIIPKYGYLGAAFTTVLTELVVLFMLVKIISKSGYRIFNPRFMKDSLKSVISSLIFGLFIFKYMYLNIIILVCVSIIIYFVSILILQVFDKEDKLLLLKISNRSFNYINLEES